MCDMWMHVNTDRFNRKFDNRAYLFTFSVGKSISCRILHNCTLHKYFLYHRLTIRRDPIFSAQFKIVAHIGRFVRFSHCS